MARVNRINLDGKGETENRLIAVAALPGTLVSINSADKFQVATSGAGVQLYALGVDTLQGKRVTDTVDADDVGIGNYFETGRSFALLVAAGTALTSDTPLTIGAGALVVGTPGDDEIVAYSKEIHTVGSEAELVIVRAA